jgi:putative peptidoglycan lipid II flippase
MATMNRAMEMCLFLTLPCAVASMVVAEPLIAAMFERGAFTAEDTWNTALTLAVFSAGLPAYILVKILTPGFFARHDTATPVRYSIITLVLNTLISLALMKPFAQLGLAAATAIASWINVGLLTWGLMKRGHFAVDDRLRRRFPRMLLAAVLMGAVLWGIDWALGPWSGPEVREVPRVISLAVVVLGGIVSYGILSQLTGALRLREIRGLMRGKPNG